MSDTSHNNNGSADGHGRKKPDKKRELIEGETTGEIINAFFEVYDRLGYGFVELPYCDALELELLERRQIVQREFPAPLFYKNIHLRDYRLDFVVNRKVVVEAKAGESLPKGSLRQLNNYLRATGFEVGLLLHFGLEPKFYRQMNPVLRSAVSNPAVSGRVRGPVSLDLRDLSDPSQP